MQYPIYDVQIFNLKNLFIFKSVDDQDILKDEPEIWTDIPEVLFDLENVDSLPYPGGRPNKVLSLLQWFVLFIPLWQANCKISNNGLEWLLRFLIEFLHVIGITSNCDFLVELSLMFPTSIFFLQKMINLDKDDFQKFFFISRTIELTLKERDKFVF